MTTPALPLLSPSEQLKHSIKMSFKDSSEIYLLASIKPIKNGNLLERVDDYIKIFEVSLSSRNQIDHNQPGKVTAAQLNLLLKSIKKLRELIILNIGEINNCIRKIENSPALYSIISPCSDLFFTDAQQWLVELIISHGKINFNPSLRKTLTSTRVVALPPPDAQWKLEKVAASFLNL